MKNLITILFALMTTLMFSQVPNTMHLSFKDADLNAGDNVNVEISCENPTTTWTETFVLNSNNYVNDVVSLEYGSTVDWGLGDNYKLKVLENSLQFDIVSVPFANTGQYLAESDSIEFSIGTADYVAFKILANGKNLYPMYKILDNLNNNQTGVMFNSMTARLPSKLEIKAMSNQLQSLPFITESMNNWYFQCNNNEYYNLLTLEKSTNSSDTKKTICVFTE